MKQEASSLQGEEDVTEDVYNYGRKYGILKYYGGEREVEVDW